MASPPPQRTSASDAASPMPVVRIFNTQNDAVTMGTLLTMDRATRGRSGAAGRVDGDVAGLDSAECMAEIASSASDVALLLTGGGGHGERTAALRWYREPGLGRSAHVPW